MSDTSSPSVHIHPISPSSSFSDSSGGTGPHSELTSDEEPDLGAFTTVLREWTHLQPPPRIPVQIRSATSSTTPTFQPSVTGSESPSNRSRNSHLPGNSALSSFTRPPSSSAQPEGSTVWAQAPIASYLYSGTPSNDDEKESIESLAAQGENTPNSVASAALTVEIASETDFEQSNVQTAPSPYRLSSDSGISLPLTMEPVNNRLNSQETAHLEEETGTSETSKGHAFQETTMPSHSEPSVQLLSQNRPSPTEALSSVTVAAATTTRLSTFVSDSSSAFFQNRSRNPEPPRAISDSSSLTTSDSIESSSFSLVSYRISDTVSEPNSDGESSSAYVSSSDPVSMTTSLALKTQKSITTSQSGSTNNTYSTQRPQHSFHHSFPTTVPIAQSQSLSSTGSPLPNPHSPLPTPEPEISVYIDDSRPMFRGKVWRQEILVDDLGTPEQPPSETLLYHPQNNFRPGFRPVIDDDDDDDIRVGHEDGRGAVQLAYSNARLNPQDPGYETGFSQHAVPSRTDYRLAHPQREENESSLFPSGNIQTHPSGPRMIGPSITPRGIPSDPMNSRSQPPNTITSTLNPVQQPHAYLTHSPQANTLSNQSHWQGSQNTSTVPLQHPFKTNQSISNFPSATSSQFPESQHYAGQFSNINTPTALPVVNQPVSYVPQHDALAASSLYSTPQRQALPEMTRSNAHGYPYSLLGLHALPTTIGSRGTSTLPSASSIDDSDSDIRTSRFPSFSDLSDDNSTLQGDLPSFHGHIEDTVLEQAVPSLGVLDGVLSFIAVERERARNNAVREGTALISTLKSDENNDTASGEEGEAVNEGVPNVAEGEGGWKHVIGNETDHPRRRRRRKRPTKTHASVVTIQNPNAIQGPGGDDIGLSTIDLQADDLASFSLPVSATSSPNKTKKEKNVATALSGPPSMSLISLPLSGEGVQTPTKARVRDKEFLIAPPSSKSASSSKKNALTVTILQRPDPAPSDEEDPENYDLDSGEKTPTNSDQIERRLLSTDSSTSPINFLGKKGKRVGKREREREIQRYDSTAVAFDLGDVDQLELDAGAGQGDLGLAQEDNSLVNAVARLRGDEDDRGDDNDSLSNLSLLKPPRRRRERSRKRKARDVVHLHAIEGITGAYHSNPGSPGHLMYLNDAQFADLVLEQGLQEPAEIYENLEPPAPGISGSPEKRKRTRSKRVKHSQSIPDLGVDSNTPDAWSSPAAYPQNELPVITARKSRISLPREDILDMDRNRLQNYLIASGSGIVLMNTKPDKNQLPPDSKRGRLIALAKQLRDSFPEQRDDLGRVIHRLEQQGGQGGKFKGRNGGTEGTPESSKPYHQTRRGGRRGRNRKAEKDNADGTKEVDGGVAPLDLDDDQADEKNEAEKLGDSTDAGDIDPRGRAPGRSDALVHIFIDHSNILIGLLSHLKRTQFYRRSAANRAQNRPLPAIISKAGTSNKAHDHASLASAAFDTVKPTDSRPLPVPNKTVDVAIPLPSFATMSHSFPTTSVLSEHMKSKDLDTSTESTASLEKEGGANSDGYEFQSAVEDDSGGGDDDMANAKDKKNRQHLWHAALVLILERGRPVTRRVVVTSSPLYQPMDGIERLGYELRVFIRVPYMGDGLDRERYKDKDKTVKSRPSGALKATQSSPISTSSASGSPSATKKRSSAHTRHLSGGGLASLIEPGSLHPLYRTSGKFREQGVDELLQLKLHQALAATDNVPEGSTIVLATGDGNVGEFNEDGFLGPVRTALRRGWRVELYAWEDGLSRAWKREFGEGSEWGRSGLFRVIGMEQFAHGLVEALQ